MTENCTIYCKITNPAEIVRLLRTHFPASLVNPTSDDWDSLIVQGDEGSLRLTPKMFRERGDEFCHLLLGTRTYVDRMQCDDAATKKAVLEHITSTQMTLGVVAEPAFDSDERYHAVVFAIAKSLNGIVFNGEEVLDANGETLAAAA